MFQRIGCLRRDAEVRGDFIGYEVELEFGEAEANLKVTPAGEILD